jgi:hypothetical protein
VAFSDEVGAPVAGGVLRQGGKEEEAQAQVYPEKKAASGVLGVPLTVEGVTTTEAAEAPAMGQLLVASSCTDGRRVVRGSSRLQSKTQWCGDTGEATVRWPYRWRSGTRGREALRQRGGGAAQIAEMRCRNGAVGRCLYGTVRARVHGSHKETAC